MAKILKLKLILFVTVLLFYSNLSNAQQVYIRVGEAQVRKSVIAIPPFQYLGTPSLVKNYRNMGVELFNTVVNDLDVSSYFTFLRQDAFLEDTSKVGLRPAPGHPKGFDFKKWTPIGAEFLIRAGYKVIKNEIIFEAYLYSVKSAKQIVGKEYKGTKKDLRAIAHTFANDVIFGLTGKKGFFLSRIVVSGQKPRSRNKEIYVMDWDGKNKKKISSHRSIALSPNWSPDGKEVIYSAFAYHKKSKARNLDMFKYNLSSGSRKMISARKGLNSGGVFTPAGNNIFLTISQGGSPDIFKMNTEGKSLSQITKGPRGAMNVEPAISPDGKKIAFSSDRSGKPMIYIMGIDGSSPQRRTYAGRYNASPSWSPDGKKVAFAGFDKGHFDIFLMNEDGTELERLTTAKKRSGKYSNNEDPVFSPDGRHVMFVSDRSGTKQLYIVNVDGTNERRVTFDKYQYFKPKWSWANY